MQITGTALLDASVDCGELPIQTASSLTKSAQNSCFICSKGKSIKYGKYKSTDYSDNICK